MAAPPAANARGIRLGRHRSSAHPGLRAAHRPRLRIHLDSRLLGLRRRRLLLGRRRLGLSALRRRALDARLLGLGRRRLLLASPATGAAPSATTAASTTASATSAPASRADTGMAATSSTTAPTTTSASTTASSTTTRVAGFDGRPGGSSLRPQRGQRLQPRQEVNRGSASTATASPTAAAIACRKATARSRRSTQAFRSGGNTAQRAPVRNYAGNWLRAARGQLRAAAPQARSF